MLRHRTSCVAGQRVRLPAEQPTPARSPWSPAPRPPGSTPSRSGLPATLDELAASSSPTPCSLDTALLFARVPRRRHRRGAAPAGPRDARRRGPGHRLARLPRRRRWRPSRDPRAGRAAAHAARAASRCVVAEVRRSVSTLRTERRRDREPRRRHRRLARHLSAVSGVPIHGHRRRETTRLRPEVEAELLRITQEAMNNAVRHAEAHPDRRPVHASARPTRRSWSPTTGVASRARATTPTAWRSCASGPACIGADARHRRTDLERRRPGSSVRISGETGTSLALRWSARQESVPS